MLEFNPITGQFEYIPIGILDARYVNITGDAMTGLLEVNPTVIANATAIGSVLNFNGNSPISSLTGLYIEIDKNGSGNVTDIYGVTSYAQIAGGGLVGALYGFWMQGGTAIATTITNVYGNYIAPSTTMFGGVITNNYGIYIDDQTVGSTLNYAIYTNIGLIRFGDDVTVAKGFIVNENGDAAGDFRVESDTEANMVFLDASSDFIQFGGTTNSIQISKGGSLTLNGTGAIHLPHMMQSDTTDQAIANVANAQVITFDTDNHHENITRTSSSRFTATKKGSYLITFSGIAQGTATKRLEFWLRVNGNDIANSNTAYVFKGTAQGAVIACSFIEHLEVNDYFEFWTWGDDVTCKWDATAAGTSPTRPAIPSIIMTCNYVSGD